MQKGIPMPASYAKPDDQKVTRHKPNVSWVELPSKREGDPPELPEWRIWQPGTLIWWVELWTKPQATQWDQDGSSVHGLACLYDDLIAGRAEIAKVSAEMRQHELLHGLSPKAMQQLHWRIEELEAKPSGRAPKPPAKSAAARRAKLRVV